MDEGGGGMGGSWLVQDAVGEVIHSERVESGQQKLRELEGLIRRWLPCLRLNHSILDLLILDGDIVIENSLILLLVQRKRAILGLQVLVELSPLCSLIETTNRPRNGIHHYFFIVSIGQLGASWDVLENTVDETHSAGDFHGDGEVHHRWVLDVLLKGLDDLEIFEVLLQQSLQSICLVYTPLKCTQLAPTFIECSCSQIVGRDVDLSTSGDCSRRGVVQVLHLEDQLTLVGHRNTLSVGKGQDLVIIEHSVQVLNPKSIDWSVAGEPNVEFRRSRVALLPEG